MNTLTALVSHIEFDGLRLHGMLGPEPLQCRRSHEGHSGVFESRGDAGRYGSPCWQDDDGVEEME